MVYLILHNIRSAGNVGSIFRTADAAGAAKIYLTGYTPAPIDRFGRRREDCAKVALGAEGHVPWERRGNLGALVARLRREGVCCVAVEQADGAVDYRRLKRGRETAFLFGNEVRGLPRRILRACDRIAEIPMRGKKESLNVSVAAGIILFQAIAAPRSHAPRARLVARRRSIV